MMKTYVSIDSQSYSCKPVKEAGIIRKRAAENWSSIDINDLADLVGNKGHAIVPGHLIGGERAENCTEMQLFVLDFDNGTSFVEIADRCNMYGLRISFAYRTYSCSDSCDKFRIVFVHETLIQDPYVLKIAIQMLHKIFPECDRSCKDLSRLFYGGKGLLYKDESACIALVQLLLPFYDALNHNDNFSRNIRSFCSSNKIMMENDRPIMGAEMNKSVFRYFDVFRDSPNIHIIGESAKTSFFIVEYDNAMNGDSRMHQSNTRTPKRNLSIIYNDHSIRNSTCQLLNDFCNGKNVHHKEEFALLTNLMNLKGGEALFFDILKKYHRKEKSARWEKSKLYIKGYRAKRCNSDFCPYYDLCENMGTIVDTLAAERIINIEPETYYSCDDVRRQVYFNIEEAICSNLDGIHLIPAQTAAGKTWTYIHLIAKYSMKKFIIAVPTNILKDEVAEKLIELLGEDEVGKTKSVEGNKLIPSAVRDQIVNYHQIGIHDQTKTVIKEELNSLAEKPKTKKRLAVIKECESLLSNHEIFKNKRVVVTTHSYLMNLGADILKDFTVIIDEDILQLQIFKKIYTVQTKALQDLSESGINIYSDIAKKIIGTRESVYENLYPPSNAKPLSLRELGSISGADCGNLNDLIYASTFVRLRDRKTGEEVVHYFCASTLPPLKYIVLSATLNEKIYRRYFGGSMNVYCYPEKKAKYLGKLIQYPYYSLSRSNLENKEDVFYYACKQANNDNLGFITFADFPGKSSISNINFLDLHFGNSAGIDKYKGQDIGIVGTYFQQEQAYKLIALYLGANVNNPADINPRPRRVTYKNKNFVITTYDDKLLQEIQLYSIESEMEQCVGRARLLRYNCTVYLFSCFPCEQAELRNGNYLIPYRNQINNVNQS